MRVAKAVRVDPRVLWCELVTAATDGFLLGMATFGNHVALICRVIPEEQVTGIAARRVVALMTDV